MICQAIDARLALRADPCKFSRGGEIYRSPCGSDKAMAKVVIVEKTVHRGAEDAPRFVHRAVGCGFQRSVALDIGESARSRS